MRRVIIFFHIEKCGGTSLVHFFRNNLPFQSCEAISRTNALTISEWKKALLVYPKLKVISGHNLQVDIIDWFRKVGIEVESFVIYRDPIERTISDYLHDYRKGTFNGTLEEYAQILWKQNYMSKFLGSGHEMRALGNLEKFDHLVPVGESAQFAASLFSAHSIPVHHPYSITNKAGGKMPDDVNVADGIRVGRYKIAEGVWHTLSEKNEMDITLFSHFEKKRVSRQYSVGEPQVRKADDRTAVGPKLASAQRNLLYKPLIGVWSKYYALPRNRFDPRAVMAKGAFC
ncbi:hypothetical protein [Parasphingorhabdus flavimaris]|uniref:hypothetical protein n=1 Tax=Parasphingorhabdus flavimaris TaxID=266812 RepID=UPI003001F4F0